MALDTRTIAIAMLAGAGVLFVGAGMTVWNGVDRFFAAGALADHAEAAWEGDVAAARRAAENAAGWMGDDARAVLPTIDPTDPASDRRLELLAAQVPGSQRGLVLVARNFGRALRGDELLQPESMQGGDGALVRHIAELAALERGPLPGLPETERYQPPGYEILHHALEARVAAAWRLGDSAAIRTAAAALLALDPDHPAARELALATAALDPSGHHGVIRTRAQALGEEQRSAAVRGLIAQIDRDPAVLGNADPARRVAVLLDLIPQDRRSARELTRWLDSGERDLEAVVAEAKRAGTPAVVTAAINRSLAAERYDLARELVARLPADAQRAARLSIAELTWDTATLAELAEDPEAYLPRVVAPHLAFDHVAFHLSSASGAIPRKGVHLRIDGKPVHANQVRRFGSLVMAPITPGSSSISLQVALDAQSVFEGTVRR